MESLWASPADGGYRLDNIPFYAVGVALNDLVDVVPDPDGGLRFLRLLQASGHGTVRLWFERAADVPGVRVHLRRLGCPSELDLDRLVAVDVPPTVGYDVIRTYLAAQESAGVLEYEEGCIAQGRDG